MSTEMNLNAYLDQRKAEDEQEDEREEQERQEKVSLDSKLLSIVLCCTY